MVLCSYYRKGVPSIPAAAVAFQYPLCKLVQQLCFEDTDECREFCEHHGLTVATDHVLLERHGYIQPEAALAVRRSVTLIEAKLSVSVGEVGGGGRGRRRGGGGGRRGEGVSGGGGG